MTTADYALIVSICSAAVALGSLAWSVWEKFIYPKPKLRVTFTEVSLVGGWAEGPPWPQYLSLSATNFGPTPVEIQSVNITISDGWFRKPVFGIVNPIHDLRRPEFGIGPFGGGLPKKLEVGDRHSLFFPHAPQSFARDRLTRVAVLDNFGRFHKVPMGQVRKVRASLEEAYAGVPFQRQPDEE